MKITYALAAALSTVAYPIAAKAHVDAATYFSVIDISTPSGPLSTGDITTVENLSLSYGQSVGTTTMDVGIPALYAYAKTDGDTISQASIAYYFIVSGATTTVLGSIEGKVSGGIDQIGYSSRVSSYFGLSGTGVYVQRTNDYAQQSSSYSFDYNEPFTFTIGQQYEVEEGVSVNAIAGAGIAIGNAFVDPMISVPVGYTLDMSPGIGNSLVPVPEPSTWAMLIIGLAGLSLIAHQAPRGRVIA
jgi:hypothetical protein